MNPFCFDCGKESIDCMCERKKDDIKGKENDLEGVVLISKAEMLEEIKIQYNKLLKQAYSPYVALRLIEIAYR
jgi:hypothetical protein